MNSRPVFLPTILFLVAFVNEAALSQPPPPSTTIVTSVVVGGAGYSGISFGSEFAHHGFKDFHILEASDRVGGRMHRTNFEDYIIEDGASIVHGTKIQPSWNQIEKYPIAYSTIDWDSMLYYDRNGVEFKWAKHCKKFYNAYKAAFKFIGRCLHPSKLDKKRKNKCRASVPSFTKAKPNDDMSFAQLVKEIGGWDYRQEKNVANARLCELDYIDWEWGVTPEELSANNTFPSPATDEVSSKELWITDPRGYEWIVKNLGAEYLETTTRNAFDVQFDDPRLHLEHKITLVKWDPFGVTNVTVQACPTVKQPRTFDSPPLFPCDERVPSDISFVANEFVSTFSLGVLKKSLEEELRDATFEESRDIAPRFDPPLSMFPDIATAIDKSFITNALRVFLKFTVKFWPDSHYYGSAFSSEAHLASFAPLWYNYDIEGVFPGSRMLAVMMFNGRSAEISQLSEDEVRNQMLMVLDGMFSEGIQAAYGRPNLLSSDVEGIYMSRWGEDPLYHGAWSTEKLGETEEESRVLASRHGNLLFSGEASCRRFYGTTGGAFEGGKRSARILMKERYGMEDLSTRTGCDNRIRRK